MSDKIYNVLFLCTGKEISKPEGSSSGAST